MSITFLRFLFRYSVARQRKKPATRTRGGLEFSFFPIGGSGDYFNKTIFFRLVKPVFLLLRASFLSCRTDVRGQVTFREPSS